MTYPRGISTAPIDVLHHSELFSFPSQLNHFKLISYCMVAAGLGIAERGLQGHILNGLVPVRQRPCYVIAEGTSGGCGIPPSCVCSCLQFQPLEFLLLYYQGRFTMVCFLFACCSTDEETCMCSAMWNAKLWWSWYLMAGSGEASFGVTVANLSIQMSKRKLLWAAAGIRSLLYGGSLKELFILSITKLFL